MPCNVTLLTQGTLQQHSKMKNRKTNRHWKRMLFYPFFMLMLTNCTPQKTEQIETTPQVKRMKKSIDQALPTVGILIFEGVIINEVVAPLDVFSNTDQNGNHLFNVVTVAKKDQLYNSAHGLKINPDFTFNDVPELSVLVVPSSYTPTNQTSDSSIVNFIKEQYQQTDYVASHCAGAFLIGESGIANNKNIVTYVTGGQSLKEAYPSLKVADDEVVSVMEDGKLISSNGSLVSYLASFDLLEKMTDSTHRKFVEESILFDRLGQKQ